MGLCICKRGGLDDKLADVIEPQGDMYGPLWWSIAPVGRLDLVNENAKTVNECGN